MLEAARRTRDLGSCRARWYAYAGLASHHADRAIARRIARTRDAPVELADPRHIAGTGGAAAGIVHVSGPKVAVRERSHRAPVVPNAGVRPRSHRALAVPWATRIDPAVRG